MNKKTAAVVAATAMLASTQANALHIGVSLGSSSTTAKDITPVGFYKISDPSEKIWLDSDDFGSGLAFAASIGFNIEAASFLTLRPEFEYSRTTSSYSRTKSFTGVGGGLGEATDRITINGVSANLYADFALTESISPYVGFGFGVFKMNRMAKFTMIGYSGSLDEEEDSEIAPAPQLMLGIDYKFGENKRWAAGLEYRRLATTFKKLELSNDTDTTVSTVSVKLRYNFE